MQGIQSMKYLVRSLNISQPGTSVSSMNVLVLSWTSGALVALWALQPWRVIVKYEVRFWPSFSPAIGQSNLRAMAALRRRRNRSQLRTKQNSSDAFHREHLRRRCDTTYEDLLLSRRKNFFLPSSCCFASSNPNSGSDSRTLHQSRRWETRGDVHRRLKEETHSDTALAPQSKTFPARTPRTRANCLSSQLSCSKTFTAFWKYFSAMSFSCCLIWRSDDPHSNVRTHTSVCLPSAAELHDTQRFPTDLGVWIWKVELV